MAHKHAAAGTVLAILFSGAALAQTPVQTEAAKLADIPCAPVDSKTYPIGPQDVLAIKVYHDNNNFSGTYTVRADGKITLFVLHDVQAAGLTPDQLTTHLTEAVAEYMINPEVTVQVLAVNSRVFHMQGEVNRPGPYALATPTTVFDALGNAGGFREFAKRGDVLILRSDGKILHFDWASYVKGKKREQNVLLENGDTVVVN